MPEPRSRRLSFAEHASSWATLFAWSAASSLFAQSPHLPASTAEPAAIRPAFALPAGTADTGATNFGARYTGQEFDQAPVPTFDPSRIQPSFAPTYPPFPPSPGPRLNLPAPPGEPRLAAAFRDSHGARGEPFSRSASQGRFPPGDDDELAPAGGRAAISPASATSSADSRFASAVADSSAPAACETCPQFVQAGTFPGSILLPGTQISVRPGGFFKVDLIHDFEPIGSTDQFNPRTIFTDGRSGENTVLQGKASRFNLDFRSPSEWGEVKGFVEGDFFNASATFRLRHAYVQTGGLTAGQTWTTFTHIEALPETLDFECPVSFLVTRQGLVRWTTPIGEHWEAAAALENPFTQLSDDPQLSGWTPVQSTPDLVGRLRYTADWGQFQVAGLFRRLGARDPALEVFYDSAAAINFTGFVKNGERDRFIYQVIVGDGAARYRGGDDLVAGAAGLPVTRGGFGWLAAYTHYWNDRWRSTGVYNVVDGATDSAQSPDAISNTDYLAANLIFSPSSKLDVGAEYLYGSRHDRDGASGVDHRIQITMYYYLR